MHPALAFNIISRVLFGFGAQILTAASMPALAAPGQADRESLLSAHEAWQQEFRANQEGVITARNLGQEWTARFEGGSFLTLPDHGQWQWGLRLRGYGVPSAWHPLSGTPETRVCGKRLTWHWSGTLEEWFVNDARGLEHGYTLRQRPQGMREGGRLELLLGVEGGLKPQISDEAKSVNFANAAGEKVLTYDGLLVFDADQRALPAHFAAVSGKEFLLVIDDSEARYPVTIDPVAQQAFLRSPQPRQSENFGSAVAISGDLAVVGVPGEASSTAGINRTPSYDGENVGAAYIYARDAEGIWTQQAYLKASNPQNNAYFGFSVAVAKGDNTLAIGAEVVVGAPYASGGGAVYVFEKTLKFVRGPGGIRLPVIKWEEKRRLASPDAGNEQKYGWAVAMNNEGVMAVGAPANVPDTLSEAVYVYGPGTHPAGGTTGFELEKKLVPEPSAQPNLFGSAVAISGNLLVVGAPQDGSSLGGINPSGQNSAAPLSGAAYVFEREEQEITVNGEVFWEPHWVRVAHLKDQTPQAGARFGSAVAISGEKVLIGIPGENYPMDSNEIIESVGAAQVFRRGTGAWRTEQRIVPGVLNPFGGYGTSVGIDRDILALGFHNTSRAHPPQPVYVYHWELLGRIMGVPVWGWRLKSSVGTYLSHGDGFGASLSLNKSSLLVGASFAHMGNPGVHLPKLDLPGDVLYAYNSGAAHIYEYFDFSDRALLTMDGGKVHLRYRGNMWDNYTIQRSTDLSHWTYVGMATGEYDGWVEFIDADPPKGAAFYRFRNDLR